MTDRLRERVLEGESRLSRGVDNKEGEKDVDDADAEDDGDEKADEDDDASVATLALEAPVDAVGCVDVEDRVL